MVTHFLKYPDSIASTVFTPKMETSKKSQPHHVFRVQPYCNEPPLLNCVHLHPDDMQQYRWKAEDIVLLATCSKQGEGNASEGQQKDQQLPTIKNKVLPLLYLTHYCG